MIGWCELHVGPMQSIIISICDQDFSSWTIEVMPNQGLIYRRQSDCMPGCCWSASRAVNFAVQAHSGIFPSADTASLIRNYDNFVAPIEHCPALCSLITSESMQQIFFGHFFFTFVREFTSFSTHCHLSKSPFFIVHSQAQHVHYRGFCPFKLIYKSNFYNEIPIWRLCCSFFFFISSFSFGLIKP